MGVNNLAKEQDLKYIKEFSKINVSSICEELKINKSNLWSGRASAKNIETVKNKIKEQLEKL